MNDRICTKCRETKPVNDFYHYRRRDGTLHPKGECKSCVIADGCARQKGHYNAVRRKRYYERNREKILARDREMHKFRKGTADYDARKRASAHKTQLKKYGLTPEEYQRIYDSQGGVCAICERPETKVKRGRVCRLSVDHNHATTLVRGLLCDTCNTTIAVSRDNPAILRRAATYLERQRLPLGLVAKET